MSPKQWLALLTFYLSYLFFGATVFYYLEQELETERRSVALMERMEIHERLIRNLAPHDMDLQNELLDEVTDYCGKPVTNYTTDLHVDPYVWSFYHSFFFCFIVISTVGYGNISPHSDFGRIFMIFYAIIGLPVNAILFAYLGDFFGKTFTRIYERYKSYKLSTNIHYVPRKFSLIFQIMMYLIPGIVVFIFLPAMLFTYFEEWSYVVSVYYSFVTLTTIGFGDYVPTFQAHQPRVFGNYFVAYQIFILLWFIAGVGYLVMIMGFLVRGLRSKQIARLEHQLAASLKHTQSRIWNGVTKDVNYVRNILNEVYMLKFKPVYTDPNEKTGSGQLKRSDSCPDLDLFCTSTPIARRKRAFSENIDGIFKNKWDNSSTLTLNRTQSDSELDKIDKVRTFEAINAKVQPGELLASVVTALGNYRPPDEDGLSLLDLVAGSGGSNRGGVMGFSDSQILASECSPSSWSLSTTGRPKERKRATSVVQLPDQSMLQDQQEWTWSGDKSQLKEIQKIRQRGTNKYKSKENLYRASLANKVDTSLKINMPSDYSPDEVRATATNRSFLSKLNPFKKSKSLLHNDIKRHSLAGQELYPQSYLGPDEKYENTLNGTKSYKQQTSHGRPSLFSMPTYETDNNRDVLENITVADLIRALEVLHTKSETSETSLESILSPKRKMGTASLTPPKLPSLSSLFGPYSGESTQDRKRSSARQPAMRTSAAAFRPTNPPPYSTESPEAMHRRFSVRPSNLHHPPGQFHKNTSSNNSNSSINSSSSVPIHTSMFQRKQSVRTSPLVMSSKPSEAAAQVSSGRQLYRPAPLSRQQSQPSQKFLANEQPLNALSLATKQISLTNLYETRLKNEEVSRRRNDSK